MSERNAESTDNTDNDLPFDTTPRGRGPAVGKYTPQRPSTIDLALLATTRQLRGEGTPAEKCLWELIRERKLQGVKFRRQHLISPYILDFYCVEAKLGIELDGRTHYGSEARDRDNERSAFLAARCIRIIRFWNDEVLQETDAVLTKISNAVNEALNQTLSR